MVGKNINGLDSDDLFLKIIFVIILICAVIAIIEIVIFKALPFAKSPGAVTGF